MSSALSDTAEELVKAQSGLEQVADNLLSKNTLKLLTLLKSLLQNHHHSGWVYLFPAPPPTNSQMLFSQHLKVRKQVFKGA